MSNTENVAAALGFNQTSQRLHTTLNEALATLEESGGQPGEYLRYAEAFLIFAKYSAGEKWQEVAAEHDEVFAGPDEDRVSADDLARLEDLGWQASEDGAGFSKFV